MKPTTRLACPRLAVAATTGPGWPRWTGTATQPADQIASWPTRSCAALSTSQENGVTGLGTGSHELGAYGVNPVQYVGTAELVGIVADRHPASAGTQPRADKVVEPLAACKFVAHRSSLTQYGRAHPITARARPCEALNGDKATRTTTGSRALAWAAFPNGRWVTVANSAIGSQAVASAPAPTARDAGTIRTGSERFGGPDVDLDQL